MVKKMASDFNEDEFISGLGNYIPTPAPAAIPAPEKSGMFRRAVGDTLVSGLQSAIAGPEVLVGLADIPTGGAVGKGLEYAGYRPKEARAAVEEWYSPEAKAAAARVEAAKGFVPTAAAMIQDPSTIYHGIIKSAAPMLMGGVAARGVKALTGASPYIAGAAGEGIVGAGSAAEQIRQQTESGRLTSGQVLSAAGTGLGQMAVGALGGRAAQKLGLEDVETMIARGSRREATEKAPGVLKRIAGGTTLEAGEETLQSAHETVMQNLALGRPTFEGVSEAAAQGMITGGAMGGAMNIMGGRKPKDLLKPAETKETPAAPVTLPPTAGLQGEMFQAPVGPMPQVNAELLADAERVLLEEQTSRDSVFSAQQDMFGPRPVAAPVPVEVPAWAMESPEAIEARSLGAPGMLSRLERPETIPETHPVLQSAKAAYVAAGGTDKSWSNLLGKHTVDGMIDDFALQDTLAKKTRDMARSEQNSAALAAMQGLAPEAVETSQADMLAGQIVDEIAKRSKAVKDLALSKKASVNKTGAIVALKARVDEQGTTSTAFPPTKVAKPKRSKYAVQERRTAQEVPPIRAAGETIPESGEGVRQGEQGPQVAGTGEAQEEVIQVEPISAVEHAAAELRRARDPDFITETQSALVGRAMDIGADKTAPRIVEMLNSPPTTGKAEDNLEWKRRVTAELDKIEAMPAVMRSVAGPTQGQTAKGVIDTLKRLFVSPRFFDKVVTVVDTYDQIPANVLKSLGESAKKTQGFFDPRTGKVWLIAGNIEKGNEFSVALHEIGVHLGMKNLLGSNYSKLSSQLRNWAKNSSGVEGDLARKALARIGHAETAVGKLSESEANDELIAYFVEEAISSGITPSSMASQPASIRAWFNMFITAIKNALRKFGIDPNTLTAEDIVDLAYGAANIELSTERGYTPKENDIRQSIADVIKDNAGSLRELARVQAKFATNATLDKVMFTEDLVKRAVSRGLETAADFGRMMNEKSQTRNKHEQQVAKILSEASELKDRDAAEQFIKDSTLSQKWAYKPEWLSEESANVDSGMKKRFSELSDEAQKVVTAIFKFGHDTRVQMQKDVNKAINDEYDRLLELETTPEGKAEVNKQRSDKISAVGKYVSALAGPYAPLKRFGNHVIVAKSKEYLEAEKNNDTKALAKLSADPKHYVVEHEEYRAKAEQRKDELAAEFKDGYAETWVKEDSHKHVTELPWSGIEKIKTTIEGMPEDTKNKEAMQSLINNLYLQMLDETSTRKSDMQRKGTAGAGDMFRSFASQGRTMAHYLSALQHNAEINKSIAAMQKDIKSAKGKERSDVTAVYNELTARYAQSLEYKDNPAIDAAMKFTSFWLLLTSPAYYIQNALQPFMLTLPVLSGRFGVNQSWNAGVKAYEDVFSYIKDTPVHQLDIEKLDIDPKEQAMLKALQAEGLLDMTITQDLGRFVEGEGTLSKGKFGKVMRKIWAGPQHVELLNRVTSALAAYRLAGTDSKNFGSELSKTTYAKEILSGTHGNYSSFNAPRFFTSSGAMRLITQFRKYQLIQLTLLAKTWHDAFKNADPEERAIARRAGLWMLGQHMVVTGAMGLPIPALIWAVAASLGSDDDEKKDPEQMLREMFGNEGFADLMTRGVPAALGLSMSTKVGMGNAFSALPFADMPKDKASYEKMLISSLGATAGVGGTMFDAMAKMSRGDYQKGIETAMPVGVKNAMKGFRIATEGVTSTAGDELLKPEDISFIDGLAQGIGLPTMKVSERQRRQGVVIEMDKFYKERTADIKRDYMSAFRAKDADDIAEVKENWRKLQAARVANGYSRQPMSVLLRAPMEQKRRERKAAGGVEYGSQNRRFVEALD